MTEQPAGLRERTRRAVQAELVSAALDLFLRQGFDATTTEQIADAGGLSRRSFFRYFSSKDDVLAFALVAPGEQLARAVESRPADEPAWIALRRGMDPLVSVMTSDARALAMTRMMLDGDALRASHAHKHRRWRADLALVVGSRLPKDIEPGTRTVMSDALSGAAIAALAAAEVEWVAQDGIVPLGELLDTAMRAIAPISRA